MSSFLLRPATRQDLQALASLKQSVWPDADRRPSLIADVLADSSHYTVVACAGSEIVGFADAFLSLGPDARRRWELDLVAVAPACRGRGLASQLVAQATRAGVEWQAQEARGLIRVDNRASQKVFARCGFALRPQVLNLYTNSSRRSSHERPTVDPDHIRVNTMDYKGLWIEAELSPGSLRSAMAYVARQDLDLAGVLVPDGRTREIRIAVDEEFLLAGQYQWWLKTYPSRNSDRNHEGLRAQGQDWPKEQNHA